MPPHFCTASESINGIGPVTLPCNCDRCANRRSREEPTVENPRRPRAIPLEMAELAKEAPDPLGR